LGGPQRRRRDRRARRALLARDLGPRVARARRRESGAGSRRRLVPRGAAGRVVLSTLLRPPLEIDDGALERQELAVSSEFRRVTTTVHLRGAGEEGRGEDVTYQADLHDEFPVPEVMGRWTVDSFSKSLDGFAFFHEELPDRAADDYRRWAW